MQDNLSWQLPVTLGCNSKVPTQRCPRELAPSSTLLCVQKQEQLTQHEALQNANLLKRNKSSRTFVFLAVKIWILDVLFKRFPVYTQCSGVRLQQRQTRVQGPEQVTPLVLTGLLAYFSRVTSTRVYG